MNIHLTSIIPLFVGMILLLIGLTFSEPFIVWVSAVILSYGILVHTKNVSIIRRRSGVH